MKKIELLLGQNKKKKCFLIISYLGVLCDTIFHWDPDRGDELRCVPEVDGQLAL